MTSAYEVMYKHAASVPAKPPGFVWTTPTTVMPSTPGASVYYFDPAAGTPLGAVFQWAGTGPAPVYKAGDVLVLYRGYHGAIFLRGVNPGTVYITAPADHTPLVRCVKVDSSSRWDVGGWVVSGAATPAGHPDNAIKAISIALGDAADTTRTTYVTLRDMLVVTTHDTAGWTTTQWRNAGGAVIINARFCALVNVHVLNGGSIVANYRCMPLLIKGCVHENFSGDGSNAKQGGVVWDGNFIYGSRVVNGNHNDLFQAWGGIGTPPMVYMNNVLVAHPDPDQPFLAKPGISDAQGWGCFDGLQTNWRVVNNIVMVDHPIGIWMLGFAGAGVLFNTIVQCGTKGTFFAKNPPCISLQDSKSGAKSSGAYVYNNLTHGPLGGVPKYGFTGVAARGGNVSFTASTAPFAGIFVDWLREDLRLVSRTAPGAGAGVLIPVPPAGATADQIAAVAMPVTDIMGNPRINADGRTYDAGAFSAGYPARPWAMAPQAPFGRRVKGVAPLPGGLGYDIAWEGVDGDKSYFIAVRGKRVGTIRSGRTVFAFLTKEPAFTAADVVVTATPTVSF
jgi:hypothetical protein